jgi:cobalt-precorrin-7 (C5)-methyltransferase
MEVNRPKIAIVGCGPGSAQYVTVAARQAVAGANVVLGNQRLLDLFSQCAAAKVLVDAKPAAMAALMEQISQMRVSGQRVAILVSGDPGLYSLGQLVVRHFGRAHCEIVPAVSSVQVAFARLGLDWAEARILSAHGRIPQISPAELGTADKIAILAGTAEAMQWSATVAVAVGKSHATFLAENLTLDDERFRQLAAEQLGTIEAASLAIVLLIRRSLVT